MDKHYSFKEFALAKLTSVEKCSSYMQLIDMTDVFCDMADVADDLLNYADVYGEFDCEFSNTIKENASAIKNMAIHYAILCGYYKAEIRKHELYIKP